MEEKDIINETRTRCIQILQRMKLEVEKYLSDVKGQQKLTKKSRKYIKSQKDIINLLLKEDEELTSAVKKVIETLSNLEGDKRDASSLEDSITKVVQQRAKEQLRIRNIIKATTRETMNVLKEMFGTYKKEGTDKIKKPITFVRNKRKEKKTSEVVGTEVRKRLLSKKSELKQFLTEQSLDERQQEYCANQVEIIEQLLGKESGELKAFVKEAISSLEALREEDRNPKNSLQNIINELLERRTEEQIRIIEGMGNTAPKWWTLDNKKIPALSRDTSAGAYAKNAREARGEEQGETKNPTQQQIHRGKNFLTGR